MAFYLWPYFCRRLENTIDEIYFIVEFNYIRFLYVSLSYIMRHMKNSGKFPMATKIKATEKPLSTHNSQSISPNPGFLFILAILALQKDNVAVV